MGELAKNDGKREEEKHKKQKMKQMARAHRKELYNISGAKRRTVEEGMIGGKKQCMEEEIAEMVEGASPQMAPHCP